MKKSLWQKDNYDKNLKSVEENLNTDILIIGAGITGVTLAYNLLNSNKDVILIDRNKFFNEVTAKSTGKLTYLQDLKYQDIENIYDFDTAKKYYESQKDAIKLVKKNVKDNNIDCNLKRTYSVTYTKEEKELYRFEKEMKFFDKLGVNYSNFNDSIYDTDILKLISVNNTYVFNPVKYLNDLYEIIKKNKNIRMYENSIATKIRRENDKYIVNVNDYEITANTIVLACNYPFFTIPFLMPFKTYLEKSYITATKVDKIDNISAISTGNEVVSYRYDEDEKNKYFLYLTNSSKLSNKLNYELNYNTNSKSAKEITDKKTSYSWMNMDVMTNDFIPYIGRISNNDKNVFIATGYNTWGMTNGTIAAKVISDLILKRKSKYENLFGVQRKINLIKIKNFAVNTLFSNIKAYSFSLIKKNPSWYKNYAVITKVNGKRVGIYFDENGDKHIVSNVCPHLKCFLTFNKEDKTWDCPCHGSRFDTEGNSIKGPSVYNIKIDETSN